MLSLGRVVAVVDLSGTTWTTLLSSNVTRVVVSLAFLLLSCTQSMRSLPRAGFQIGFILFASADALLNVTVAGSEAYHLSFAIPLLFVFANLLVLPCRNDKTTLDSGFSSSSTTRTFTAFVRAAGGPSRQMGTSRMSLFVVSDSTASAIVSFARTSR